MKGEKGKQEGQGIGGKRSEIGVKKAGEEEGREKEGNNSEKKQL